MNMSLFGVGMGKNHRLWQLAAAAACMAGLACPASAGAAPAEEPRVMTQLGLETPLALNLLQSTIDIIDNFNVSPPACTKLISAGSIETLSVQKIATDEYSSKIDVYFDAACKKPYFEAAVTVKLNVKSEILSIAETATYFQANRKTLGKLAVSSTFAVGTDFETIIGLGKFAPVGGQPAAEVGFACAIPTSGTSLSVKCQSGVAQTFKSLNLSIASVVPFTVTAASNADGAKITFKGTASDVRTGPAGSLSITAPAAGELGIGGGGTVYTSTALSGSYAKFVLFPPSPSNWSVTDKKGNAAFSAKVVAGASRGIVATVKEISTKDQLASLKTDETGTGKVTYSDGSSAAVRGFLAGN